jgi:signal transduction histidine kinase/pSer/pThr/pTyr-binding forkhead associated (FHA) protein
VATLVVITGNDENKRFDLTSPVTGIGREGGNTIRLHDTEVSRRHAEVRLLENGAYKLVDLGSSNGTFVNNHPIQEAVLKTGDHVMVGQTDLVFMIGTKGDLGDDLADRINMIGRAEVEAPSAIVKTIREGEGSRVLAQPEQAKSPWLRSELAELKVMYEVTRATSLILDADPLLDRIMDLLFQSIQADRGCIMLLGRDSGHLEPKAIRYRPGVDRQEKIAISRSIIDYVLKDGQGVLVSDATRDARFGSAQSIVRFGIREAICVPMKGRHETIGVLYLDTQTSPQQVVASGNPSGKLTEDHLTFAAAIGHQAALALEDTRYHQAMLQAERLAAIGQTIAAISHHVKNILQGLKSGSDLLRMGMQEKNDQFLQQGWGIVEKNQGRIYELVMDMLSYSKDREPALEPTDVNAIVRDVLELEQGRIEKQGVRVIPKLQESLPIIAVDPEGLHRTLLNIVGNALDALDDRENPTITVATMLETDTGWVRIAVKDNGPGIPLEKQHEIFKPFVSTKGAKGTGLGLAVSRKIMREHGGDIVLQSQVGKGSIFILRLPPQSTAPAELETSMGHTAVPDGTIPNAG